MRVVVLSGGISGEAEVSRMSGREVLAGLLARGHQATLLEFDTGAFEELRRHPPDLVFPVLHGPLGEDGTAAAMLELLELPYVGSGILAGALAMNKVAAKRVFLALGLPTPDYRLVHDVPGVEEACEAVASALGYPLVVKPNSGGSSLGLTIAHDPDSLLDGVRLALRLAGPDHAALVESFRAGVEITIGVLGVRSPRTLPSIEIEYREGNYDFEAKYTHGKSHHVIPARIPAAQLRRAEDLALAAHGAIGARGISRVDMICEPGGATWILELNTMPGMTPLSLFPDAARAAGIEFADLVNDLATEVGG
ncbi:MAG: D-alanine--D-alanine ligase family protein [Candidatus Dormibacteria bacterium]